MRTITQGEIVGFRTRADSFAWTGIPFAEPISPEVRFTLPKPHTGWNERRAFVEDGPACLQFGAPRQKLPEKGYQGQEDCLNLNVFAPATPSADNLPVIVWIHGGGETLGAASGLLSNRLVADQQVVLISLQYRLGPFGFFSHPALREEGIPTANFALEDLILALQWVQDNAAVFGGDSNNVTLMGESAGARNIFALMLSPRAAGLFDKAIMQSGTSSTTTLTEAEQPQADGGLRNNSSDIIARLLVRVGKAETEVEARTLATQLSSADLLAFLRSVPELDMMQVYQKDEKDVMYSLPTLIRDDFTLTSDEPGILMRDKEKHNSVPLLIGTNRDELKPLLLFTGQFTKKGAFNIPEITDLAKFNRTSELLARAWKYSGADLIADWVTESGSSAFVYRFDWDEEPVLFGKDASVLFGAAHAYEIPFVFGMFEETNMPKRFLTKENAAGREELSAKMRNYWGQFAYAGTPGQGVNRLLPDWPRWTKDTTPTLLLDTDADGGIQVISDPLDEESLVTLIETDHVIDGTIKCWISGFMVAVQMSDQDDFSEFGDGMCVK